MGQEVLVQGVEGLKRVEVEKATLLQRGAAAVIEVEEEAETGDAEQKDCPCHSWKK
jgi:hypothetical protein